MKEPNAANAVGVVGLGHVGRSTAVSFAAKGIETIGVDIDEERVQSISRGRAPFVEQDLPRLLPKAIKTGKLKTSSDASALATTAYQFVTVPTPNMEDGSIDLGHVRSAARAIGRMLRDSEGYRLVVVKSTVTPGTALKEVLPILEATSGKKLGDFGLASNPEFLREGYAIEDTLHPDRIVIGVEDSSSQRPLLRLYRRFYGKLPTTLLTTTVNAELIKYASNAFLATKVAFINEIANFCFRLPGADISIVATGMGLDERISPGFLKAGLGYGGSCLPKDLSALLKAAKSVGVRLGVAEAVTKGNDKQAAVAVELAEHIVGELAGKKVAMLGLAFKPDSDDMRDAVSLRLIPELINKGCTVVAYDPFARENARAVLGDKIGYGKSAKECLTGADCCILVTEWAEFSKLSPNLFKRVMRTPVVVDGRRVLERDAFLKAGVKFAAIGLGGGRP